MKQFLIFLLVYCQLFTGIPAFAEQRIITADIIEGQDSGKNYAGNKGHFERNVNGISAYADAAGTSAVDGTGGAPTLTCTRTTSSPISGDGMLLITKDAANRQGNGCSMAFSIDSGDKATMQQIEFSSIVPSGTFAAGTDTTNSDIIVQVYDVTNAAIIPVQGTGRLFSNSSSLAEPFRGYFQAAPNSTSYRLIWHVTSTSASAYTVGVDNVKIQKSKVSLGAMITDWVTWTPTGSWSTNTTYTGRWRRVGNLLQSIVNVTLAGAPTTADLTINYIPTGLSLDSTKVPFTGGFAQLGYGTILDSGTRIYPAIGSYNGGNSAFVNHTESGNTGLVNQANPMTFASGDQVNVFFEVPIVGWGGTTQISDGYDSRPVAARYSTAVAQAIANGTDTIVDFGTKDFDLAGSVTTGASWKFTAPSFGYYKVSCLVEFTNGGGWSNVGNEESFISLYKNGSSQYRIASIQAQAAHGNYVALPCASTTIPLSAGDYIDLRIYQSSGASLNLLGSAIANWIAIERVPAPTTVSMAEKFAFMAEGASSSALGTNTVIPFNTPSEDTHSCWNSTNKDCAVPYSGTYKVTCAARATFAGASVNQYMDVIIQVDTVTKREFVKYLENTGVAAISVIASYQARLTAGQKIRCLGDTNLTAGTLTTGATHTYMEIALIK